MAPNTKFCYLEMHSYDDEDFLSLVQAPVKIYTTMATITLSYKIIVLTPPSILASTEKPARLPPFRGDVPGRLLEKDVPNPARCIHLRNPPNYRWPHL